MSHDRSAFGLFAASMLCSSFAFAGDPIQRLANDLCAGPSGVRRIAVMDFPYHDGRISAGSSIVQEKLTSAIAAIGMVEVIERRLIEKIVDEMRLQVYGIVEERSARRVAKVLGVEAIVSGTLMDLPGDNIEINARMIDAQSGKIICVAKGEIKRAWPKLPDLPAAKEPAAAPEEMALIPAGSFWMGDDAKEGSQRPRHRVFVDAFLIDKKEVTIGQFERFSEATGYPMPPQDNFGKKYEEAASHPVTEVTWYDAVAYCGWLEKRLPTEAEWEKAARGGSETALFFGDNFRPNHPDRMDEYAWYAVGDTARWNGNTYAVTHPVGGKKPNQYGLYDVYGNVWEWVWDLYCEDAYNRAGATRNPYGAGIPCVTGNGDAAHVLRGGSWVSDYAREPASSLRHHSDSSGCGVSPCLYGFRCAKSVK